MTDDEALALIRRAIEKVSPGAAARISKDTDLVRDAIVDSLDIMNFIFQLEKMVGFKIDEIAEDFTDFRVSTLIDFIRK